MSSYQLPMGPIHVVLEEPVYFQLELEGETVVGLDIHAGHVHRGMEFLAMQRNIYQNLTLTERVCSLCSNNHPFTYCMALEKIAGITVPARARYLRVIADEIKRIASHLFNTGLIAHIVGFDTLFMQAMEIRETVQDIKEAVYGNRMNLSANCIGGVRYDVPAEQVAYIARKLNEIKKPVAKLLAIYQTNSLIRKRTEGVGILPKDKAIEYGVVGPVARASGLTADVRIDNPYACYDEIALQVAVEQGGDAHARALVRLKEVIEAIGIIEQCLARLPAGPIALNYMPEIPAGQDIAKSEAPRGELLYYLKTNGTDIPERLKWRVPTYHNWEALQVMMPNNKLADISVILGSIDPCISCTER